MKDFSSFTRAHHFYSDAISFDYILPDEIMRHLAKDGRLLPFVNKIIGGSYENALDLLVENDFGLEESEETAFKNMLLALSLAPKNRHSYYDNSEYENFKARKNILNELFEKQSGDRAEYYYNFALLFLKADEPERAVGLLEKALAINPKINKAHIPLALIYTVIEDWQKGYEHAKAAKEAGFEIAANLMEICLLSCSVNLGIKPEGRVRLEAKGDIEEALNIFPEIHGETDHSSHERKIIMVGCDSKYLKKHVVAFAASVEANDPDSAFHIHLTNPSENDNKIVEEMRQKLTSIKIFLSYDYADYSKYMNDMYYLSTVRDVRLYQLVKRNAQRFIRVDADSLLVKKLTNQQIFAHDIVLPFGFRTHMPYWERIINGLKSVKQSAGSLKFLQELVLLIADNFKAQSHLWFSDQIYVTWLYEKYKKNSDVGLADNDLYLDLHHSDDSLFWTVTHDKEKAKKYLSAKHGFLRKYGLEKYIDSEELKNLN